MAVVGSVGAEKSSLSAVCFLYSAFFDLTAAFEQ